LVRHANRALNAIGYPLPHYFSLRGSMRIGIASALVGVALAAAGCNPSETTYAVSLAEGLARLGKADVIGFRNARQCGLLIHFEKMLPDGYSITWRIRSKHLIVASFAVSLSQAGNGIQATISVPKAADGGEIYDGKQHYSHPALMQPLRPSIREMVDAAMEQRPFDWHRLPNPLNVGPNATLTNCGMGRDSLQRGVPVELDDPEGVPHDIAIKLGLIR
jgi:hypothetical protein